MSFRSKSDRSGNVLEVVVGTMTRVKQTDIFTTIYYRIGGVPIHPDCSITHLWVKRRVSGIGSHVGKGSRDLSPSVKSGNLSSRSFTGGWGNQWGSTVRIQRYGKVMTWSNEVD